MRRRFGNPRKVLTPEEKAASLAAKRAIKETATKVFETLLPATQSYRDEYIAKIVEIRVEILNNMRKNMAENGMDLNKVAPYPRSNIGHLAYMLAIDTHRRYTAVFETVRPEGYISMSETARLDGKAPWIVAEKTDAENKVRVAARKDAAANFDSFLYKMGEKIGKLITGATMTGRLWDGCNITVVCQDGETQSWDTQCILNRSIYNNFFNQWPTRRVE